VRQYADESSYCEFLLSELVAFNDPEDDEYEERDEDPVYYLGDKLSESYWIFSGAANGDVGTYLKLYFETSRVDVIKALAYSRTFYKLQKKR
jgi:hypothetical protein